MFNERRHALENAFLLVDAHQHVTRRILNDMFHRRVRPVPLHPDDAEMLQENGDHLPWRAMFTEVGGQEVDYEWYFEQYNLHRAIIIGFMALRQVLGLDTPAPTESEAPVLTQENDMEFGGDYEQNQVHGDTRPADPR